MTLRVLLVVLALAAWSCGAAPPKPKAAQFDDLKDIADDYVKPDGASGASESEEGGSAGGDSSEAPPSGIPGMADYEDARSAVAVDNLPRAVASLQKAVAANDECAEFWYNLGAAQANLAIETVDADEAEAAGYFRDSVDSKRRALDLMNQGKFQFYGPDAQAQVMSDAQNGLEDADEVLADQETLIKVLHMYANAR